MTRKRFFYALEKTIFYGACIHLLLLLFHALRTGKFVYIDMADILDLKLLFPNLTYTPLVTALATLPIIAIFAYHFFKAGHASTKQK